MTPLSAEGVVRGALADWARGLVADIMPAATVEGGPVEAGAAPDLPTLGVEWGRAQLLHVQPVDVPISEGNDARIWFLGYEDVPLAFVWRAATPDDADFFAHEFARRAALAAMESNDDGNRVLHFEAQLGEVARTGKLYLDGIVAPEKPDENVTRSLYTYRVPGSVSYPSYAAESPGAETGLMNITVVINGKSFELAEILNA